MTVYEKIADTLDLLFALVNRLDRETTFRVISHDEMERIRQAIASIRKTAP